MTETGTSVTLTPYVPRLVVEWLRDDPDQRARSLEGTLAFVDISGFTAMSEALSSRGKAGAEEVTDVMNATFARLLEVAYGEGGTLLKFGGDALLLFYAGDEHAPRATKAVIGMRDALASMGAPMTSAGPVTLQLHAAVHTGTFDFFLVGETHRELLVAGPAVTETAAIEDVGEAGEIVVSDATAAQLDPALLGEERPGGRLVARAPDAAGRFEEMPDADGLPLEQLLPPPVRRHALASTHESEHRQAAVAFIRFGNTDALSAEERAVRLDLLVRLVQDACEAHGVTFLETDIDKDGGRIILVSGAPETQGGDEERLLRTLRAIVESEPPLPLRIGANRGRVFAGLVGTPFRRTYTILGDTAALAARLMAKAADSQVLASAALVERSDTRFEVTPLEPFMVKGKSEPVRAFELGAIVGRAETERGRLPLVDRQRERALLSASIGTVRAGFGSFVELVGDPGIGKSRLTEEIEDQCADMRKVETSCEQYEASTPYFPFRTLLRSLLDVDSGEGLQDRVAAIDPELVDWTPLLAIPLDVEVGRTQAVDDLDPSFRRARLHGVVSTVLERLLPDQTLMLFEDVHWMDEASSDLLRHIGTQVATKPWLACTTRRPVETGFSALDGVPPVPAITLRLDPLPEADALELAGLVGAGLDEAELRAITDRSGGNPLFLQQLAAADADEELPETVEATLAARIDRLDLGDRALLRWASVLGVSFSGEVIAQVLEADPTAAADSDAWDRLNEFVERDPTVPGAFRFRHALIRDAAYDGLPYSRRQELHERVARVYEQRHPDALELLALHFSRAGLDAETWRYSMAAGRDAQSKWANVEAAEFYRRALDVAPADEPAEVAAVWESLADVLELAGEFDQAAAALDRALELDMSAGLLLKAGRLRAERMGRYEEAIEWYDRGYAVADDEARVRLAMAHASALYREGAFEEAADRCLAVVGDANARGDLPTLAHAYYLLHLTYSTTGSPERIAFRGLALPIYEELGDLSGQAAVLNNLGSEAYWEGRWDESIDLYDRARELRRRTGDVARVAQTTANIAEVLLSQGRLSDAEQQFRTAIELSEAPMVVQWSTMNLGRIAARMGRYEEAEDLLEGALTQFREMHAAALAIEAEARLAELEALRGRAPEALLRAQAPLTSAREVGGMAPIEALLHRVVGMAHVQLGEPARAADAFEASLEIARKAENVYEIALTQHERAILLGDAEARREAAETFARLGVVAPD